MKNRFLPLLILSLVFVVVFNVVFYAVMGTQNAASVWVAYAFVHISYIALLATPKFIPAKKDEDSFEYPLYVISSVYFVLTLIAAAVFMYNKYPTVTVSLVVNSILFGLYLVVFISHVMAAQGANCADESLIAGKTLIDTCCAKLSVLKIKFASDAALTQKLTLVYDVIHSSTVKTSKNTQEVEHKISETINLLETQNLSGDIEKTLDVVLNLFKERDILLRQNR